MTLPLRLVPPPAELAAPFTPTFVSVVVPSHLPQAIGHLRRRFGWSVRRTAELADVSPSTLHRAENGYTVDATTLVKLTAFIRTWWWKPTWEGARQ